MNYKTKTLWLGALLAAGTVATPALAQDGQIQLKLLGSGVLPDGKINKVKTDNLGLPADSQTKADDNYVPTFAFEFFLTPEISAETYCCTTQHDVDGTGALDGAGIVSDALIIPATVTVKYHADLGGGFKPYVGAGPAWFIFLDEKPGATMQALGATSMDFDGGWGFALQAGLDYYIGDSGLGLTLDAKKYWVDVDAQFYDDSKSLLLETEHSVDPWVVSAGLAWRM